MFVPARMVHICTVFLARLSGAVFRSQLADGSFPRQVVRVSFPGEVVWCQSPRPVAWKQFSGASCMGGVVRSQLSGGSLRGQLSGGSHRSQVFRSGFPEPLSGGSSPGQVDWFQFLGSWGQFCGVICLWDFSGISVPGVAVGGQLP